MLGARHTCRRSNMCGIVGYVGPREAEPILVEGLRRLEYRGYDSAGLATLTGPHLHIRKQAGRVAELVEHLRERPAPGCRGISHTRWATHGPATDANAHPHIGGDGVVAVVHNGVIENYAAIKRQLQEDGVLFESDTDTEVIAHLIAQHLKDDLIEAVLKALAVLKGTYGLAVVSPRNPELVIGARLGSPLVVGLGHWENFLASDPAALMGYTEKVVYLQDRQICVLTAADWHVLDQDRARVEAHVEQIDWDASEADKAGYEHYMLKEIYEQPEAVENAMRGRLADADASAHFGGLNLNSQQLRRAERFIFTACGTSYHAALVGEYLFEELARIPVEVEYASEFRYRNQPIDRNPIVLALTQSGQTAGPLGAMPRLIRRTLKCHDEVRRIAERYASVSNCLYLGRQFLYPVALEGALKLKEISYIHAEGYPAAEMKHGPIALVDSDTPSVFLIPRGAVFDKVMSNLEEIKARGGPVIAVACEGDEDVAERADEVIYVPEVPDYLQPLVAVIPLQLLAYHIALLRGCDVDKPRNLAKSVTVE